MKLSLENPILLVHLKHAAVTQRQHVQIRATLLLVLLQLLHSSFQRLTEILRREGHSIILHNSIKHFFYNFEYQYSSAKIVKEV